MSETAVKSSIDLCFNQNGSYCCVCIDPPTGGTITFSTGDALRDWKQAIRTWLNNWFDQPLTFGSSLDYFLERYAEWYYFDQRDYLIKRREEEVPVTVPHWYFTTTPWKHQLQAFEEAIQRDCYALFMDVGCGKTKVVYDLICNRELPPSSYILVVTIKAALGVWADEARIHAPTLDVFVLDDSLTALNKAERIAQVRKEWSQSKQIFPPVFVVNYESVWRTGLADYIRKTPPVWAILDESHKIKSAGSKVSKFFGVVGKYIKYRNILTATPMANSPLDIYGQYRFLSPQVFGTNFNNFQSQYAIMGGFQNKQVMKYQNLDQLSHKVNSCSIQIAAKDALDMPDSLDTPVHLRLPATARRMYDQFLKESILQLQTTEGQEQHLSAKNVLSVMLRLQQMTSGYAVTDERGVIELHTEKAIALRDFLDSIPPHEPVVVFARFTYDLQQIRQVAYSLGLPYFEISGKAHQLGDWKQAEGGVIGVQIQAGNAGISLVKARYAIYYSLSHSLSDYLQSRGRLVRPGQTRPVTFMHLLVRNSIDTRVFAALRKKEDIVRLVMNNPRLLQGDTQ